MYAYGIRLRNTSIFVKISAMRSKRKAYVAGAGALVLAVSLAASPLLPATHAVPADPSASAHILRTGL
jgi:hypothetical protein